jgi:hypothetical protein
MYSLGFNARHIRVRRRMPATDKCPVLAQHAEQEAFSSTTSVLPLHGVLAGNPAVLLERNRVDEPSLSAEAECLSLQAQYSTNVQNSQIEKGAAFLPMRRTQGTPAVVC